MRNNNDMELRHSIYSTICDRCHTPASMKIMSKFNTDMICPTCDRYERGHSQYRHACQAEEISVRKGDMNFPGIGLPDDFNT